MKYLLNGDETANWQIPTAHELSFRLPNNDFQTARQILKLADHWSVYDKRFRLELIEEIVRRLQGGESWEYVYRDKMIDWTAEIYDRVLRGG